MWNFGWFNKFRNNKKQETTLRQDGSNIDVDVNDTTSFEQSHPEVLNQVEDLSSFLYNEKGKQEIFMQSLKNLYTLQETYDYKKMVSFIGAGTSKPLGISDWEDLMKELRKKAEDDGFNIKIPKGPYEWPQAAQDIYDHFNKNGNINTYLDTISKNMTAKYNTTSMTLVNLVLAFNIHLTTNFDNSIEHAYTFLSGLPGENVFKKNFEQHYLPDFEYKPTAGDSDLIYYLHGNTNTNTYIFKKSDYEMFYPRISGTTGSPDSLENFLKERYKYNNILFVGFSFSDYYVRKLFFGFAEEVERDNKKFTDFCNQSEQPYRAKEIRHFLVIDAKTMEANKEITHDILPRYNIYPIIYKDGNHVFIEKLGKTLSKRNET